MPLKTISEILGHSDIKRTQNVYQHVFMESKRDAMGKMDELLNPVATKLATNSISGKAN